MRYRPGLRHKLPFVPSSLTNPLHSEYSLEALFNPNHFISRQSSSLPDHGALCRATWTTDRLWALAPAIGGPHVGTATTKRRDLGEQHVKVNIVTKPRGELRLELLDASGNVLDGFSRDDCQPVSGDHHAALVEWTSGSRMPEKASRIRFCLKRAFLYGFSTE